MSGGKETPRQKMIGMMYLVLTALLALQVSNSVLEKFVLMEESIDATNVENISENIGKVESIQEAVKESGSRDKDVAVLDKAQQVRNETNQIIEEIKSYKVRLVKETGGKDEATGSYIGQKDVDASSNIFINQGVGEDLKDRLDSFAQYLRETTGDDNIVSIAKAAKDIPVFAADPNQRDKGFAELNFGHNTPMVGALASLAQFQADIIAQETKALEELARQVGAEDLKFDVIVPMVRPESKVVAAGTLYKAEMFIAASSSSVTPTMTLNGNDLDVVGGKGQIEFTARPGNYDEHGNSRQSYIGTITVKLPGGRDTTFRDTVEYFVQRPVMQIQSASVQALYLNCGNELNVQVPALGTSYNPGFKAKGGQAIPGAEKGIVTVVPKSANVTLSVSSNGNLIGTQDFKVRRIPKPEIKVYSRGREVDQKRGVKSAPRSIQLRAEADESFQQFLPKDARFRVSQSEIALVRAGRAVQVIRPNGPDVNLSQLAGQARSGDAIVIEVKKVQRRNFNDKTEDFNNFGPRILTIRVN